MEKQKKLKPIRKAMLLDEVTIGILENYGLQKSGTKNISSAIRQMAREFESLRMKR